MGLAKPFMIQKQKAGAGIARSGISEPALTLLSDKCAPMASQSQSMAEITCAAETPHPAAPWEVCPQQLVSWWHMQQFSAVAFYWSGQMLENLKVDCLLKPGAGDQNFNVGILYEPIDEATLGKAIDTLQHIERESRGIGLHVSAETIKHDILDRLQTEAKILSYQWLSGQLVNVQRLIQREMSNRLFLFISPEKAKFWPRASNPHPFGEQVYKAFPSAHFDIHNASVCLGTSLATAAVFHLMRVLEVVLGVLGSKFGVSLAHTNWAPAIEQIESKVREIHKDPVWKAMPDYKDQQSFYLQAASYFGVVKDAWRNHTMHIRGKYTEQEAENIYNSVKAITQKLAERLSE